MGAHPLQVCIGVLGEKVALQPMPGFWGCRCWLQVQVLPSERIGRLIQKPQIDGYSLGARCSGSLSPLVHKAPYRCF